VHELSIAQSVVDIVLQHVPDDRGGEVRTVHVRVGRLSGVVPDSLEFCFEAIVRDTRFAGARLAIESVPVRCRCARCESSFEVEPPAFFCPGCGQSGVEVLAGNELQVVGIELADTPAEVP
jgi:hydrogenase nickel incorporation protein HypA/HybF